MQYIQLNPRVREEEILYKMLIGTTDKIQSKIVNWL
jgi:hypothetical protein